MADLIKGDDDFTLGGFGYNFEGGSSSKKELALTANILTVLILLCILYCCYNTMCQTKGEAMLGNVLLPDYSRKPNHYGAIMGDVSRNNASHYLNGTNSRQQSKGIEFEEEGLTQDMGQYLKTGNSADSFRQEKAEGIRLTSQLYSGN